MKTAPSRTLAKLDLSSDAERTTMELIRYMHGGKVPTWRMLDICRVGDELVELAQWHRGGYVVLTWSLVRIHVKMEDQPSLTKAKRAFMIKRTDHARDEGPSPQA